MTKQQITEDEFNKYVDKITEAVDCWETQEPVLRGILTELDIEIVQPPREWKDGDVVNSKAAEHGIAWYVRRSGTWHEIAYIARRDRYRKYTDEQISKFVNAGQLTEWTPEQ